MGQEYLLLTYIVYERDIPLTDIVYQTVHEHLVNKAILHVAEYNMNKRIVLNLLKSLTLNGSA
jgi:hypothetical protein